MPSSQAARSSAHTNSTLLTSSQEETIMASEGETKMASEGEARPASPASEPQDHSWCNQEIATLRKLLEESQRNAERETKQTALLKAELDLTIAYHQEVLDIKTKHHQNVLDLTSKHFKREYELFVEELITTHAMATAALHSEIATLREELASLRAQYTGRGNSAERGAVGVRKEQLCGAREEEVEAFGLEASRHLFRDGGIWGMTRQ
jgi:hypothetical protein